MTTERSDWPDARSVDVWQTALAEEASGRLPGEDALSPDEVARADRFMFAKDRAAFASARIWLRRVLGAYLTLPPEAVRFVYGLDGKPALAAGQAASGLCFNLSHSGGRAVLAVTVGREIGIDVEAVRPVDPDVAGRFFAPGEIRDMVPASRRQNGLRPFSAAGPARRHS